MPRNDACRVEDVDGVDGAKPKGVLVEIEVMPPTVATETAARTTLLLWSMDEGAGCDAQYLTANDILGYTDSDFPRHSKVYRYFKADYAPSQAERAAAFTEFGADVTAGSFSKDRHLVVMPHREFKVFTDRLCTDKRCRLT